MTDQITISLPTEILQRAEQLARCTGRSVDQLLAETIELSLRPLGTSSLAEEDMAEWSDERVLAAADEGLSGEEDRRLSELLNRQQAGTLTDAERPELVTLMELYQSRLLRKAKALRESVRRGLRPSLQP